MQRQGASFRRSGTALVLALALAGLLTLAPFAAARPTVAVVLGGGAARGFSHIGLLKAFEEEGIPVDFLVGSSMGSIIAGLYAAGFSTGNLEALANDVDFTSLFDPLLPPRGGFLATDRFERFLNHLTQGARIEDLPLPYYTVVTDLVTGEEIVLSSGSLSRAIVASMSIPGIFPPVEIDGRHVVDGGMKNAVPANVAHELGADVIIAVDVKKELEHIDHDKVLTNLQLALYFMIDGYVDQNIRYADVVIVPGVQYDSYMDYGNAAYFINQGYTAAKAAMPEIRAVLAERDPAFSSAITTPPAGLSPEAFRTRLDEAFAASQRTRRGFRLSLRPSFHPELELDVSAAYLWGDGRFTPFVALDYRNDRVSTASYSGLRLGLGDCHETCAAVRLRKYRGEADYVPGVEARFRIADSTDLEAEAENISSSRQQWRVALSTQRVTIPQQIERTYRIEIGDDRRGFYDPSDAGPYLVLSPEVRVPVVKQGLALWEVAQVYPAIVVGGSAKSYLNDGLTEWRLQPWIGLRLETRLFGLHPIWSRFVVSYDGHDQKWRWGVVLAE